MINQIMPVNSLYLQDTEIKRLCSGQSSGSSKEVEEDQHEEPEIMEERLTFGGSGAVDREAPEGKIRSNVILNVTFMNVQS